MSHSKPFTPIRFLDDGFGNAWQCPNGLPDGVCEMEIVRPGKVQCVCDGGAKTMMQEIKGLNDELERLELAIQTIATDKRDAERYRLLRAACGTRDRMVGFCIREWHYSSTCEKASLDEALDAALATSKCE